jgi:hypothetical protein
MEHNGFPAQLFSNYTSLRLRQSPVFDSNGDLRLSSVAAKRKPGPHWRSRRTHPRWFDARIAALTQAELHASAVGGAAEKSGDGR